MTRYLSCQFCDERLNSDQSILKPEFYTNLKATQAVKCQSVHNQNTDVIVRCHTVHGMFAKYILLFSMKPNLYFKSLNTCIFVTLVVPLLLSESVWCTVSQLTNAKERCQRHIYFCCKKIFMLPHLNCQL